VMAYTDNGYQAGTGGVTSTAVRNAGVDGVTANSLRMGTDSASAANLQLQSFVAYPNPFRDGFTIGFNATDANQEVDIQVFNAAGMVLYHQGGIYTHPGTNLVNVNLSSSLPTGWYFATVRIAGKVEKVFKLVKNK